MLWCRSIFTQCLIFGQHGLGLWKYARSGWHRDLMHNLVHRNWGEIFVKLSLDFSKFISRVTPPIFDFSLRHVVISFIEVTSL